MKQCERLTAIQSEEVQPQETLAASAGIANSRTEVSTKNQKKKFKKKIRKKKALEGRCEIDDEENEDGTEEEDFQDLEDVSGGVCEDTELSQDAPPLAGASSGTEGSIPFSPPKLTKLPEVEARQQDWQEDEDQESERQEEPGRDTLDIGELEDTDHLHDAPPLVGAPPGTDGSSTPSLLNLTAISEGHLAEAELPGVTAVPQSPDHLWDASPLVGAPSGTQGSCTISPPELTASSKVELQIQKNPPAEPGRSEDQGRETQDQREEAHLTTEAAGELEKLNTDEEREQEGEVEKEYVNKKRCPKT